MEWKRRQPQGMHSITPAELRKHGIASYQECTTKIPSAISNSAASIKNGLAWKLVEGVGQLHHGFVRESAFVAACLRRISIQDSLRSFLTPTLKSVDTTFAPKTYLPGNSTSHMRDWY